MSQLTIPSLSLFRHGNSPSRHRQQIPYLPTHSDHSIYQSLNDSSNIRNHTYLPHIAPPPLHSQHHHHLNEQHWELNYIHAYKDAINRQSPPISYRSTFRPESFQSFAVRRKPCSCQSPPHPLPKAFKNGPKMLINDSYQNEKGLAKPMASQEDCSARLVKEAYLSMQSERQNNKLQKVVEDKFHDISTFVKQDKSVNVNKSLMINEQVNRSVMVNQSKARVAEIQVQTEEPAVDRSSFLISKVVQKVPQLMNQQNFKKSIKELNQQISSLKLDLNSDDIIIDLSDLVLTKDQYIDQSRSLLAKLSSLSVGKVIEVRQMSKTNSDIVWPEGV